MRKTFFIFCVIFFTVPGCKRNETEPTTPLQEPVEEEFFQATNSPKVTVRDLAIGANGVMFAETPNGIMQSVDSGKSWNMIKTFTSVGAIAADTQGNVYAIDFSGIYSSTDNGASWKYRDSGLAYFINDTISALFSPRALAIATDGTVYVGGASGGGVGKSTDHGASWHRTSMPAHEIVALHIASSGTIIASPNSSINGFFRSTDAGSTWVESDSVINEYITDLASDTLGNVYACGTDFVWRSTNDGITWNAIASVNGWMTSIAVNKKNHIYTVVVGAGTFVSTDFGANWKKLKSGIPQNEDRCLLLDNKQYLFAGTDNFGIYRSKKPTNE